MNLKQIRFKKLDRDTVRNYVLVIASGLFLTCFCIAAGFALWASPWWVKTHLVAAVVGGVIVLYATEDI